MVLLQPWIRGYAEQEVATLHVGEKLRVGIKTRGNNIWVVSQIGLSNIARTTAVGSTPFSTESRIT